jgi:hypothetical protein
VGVEWLRYRKVLLSEALTELSGLTFDAFVLNDWSGSGAANWPAREGEAPIANALASLSAIAAPGAVVVPLGLTGEDVQAWEQKLLPFSDTEGMVVQGLPIPALRLRGGRDLASPGVVIVVAVETETAELVAHAITTATEGRWTVHTLVSRLGWKEE